MPRDELRDAERQYLVERPDPVLDESILQCRDDPADEHIARDQHLVVGKMDEQITDRVRSLRNPEYQSHAVDERLRLRARGVGDIGRQRPRSGELASDVPLHEREPLVTGLENHLAAHLGADERGAFERHVSEIVIAVVVRIHHVRDWLVRDSAHRCRDVPAHLVRAPGVDKDHPFVANDDRRVDHVALVEPVRVLDRPEKNVDPVVDLDCPRFGQRLPMRCRAEGEEGDQRADLSHVRIGLPIQADRPVERKVRWHEGPEWRCRAEAPPGRVRVEREVRRS